MGCRREKGSNAAPGLLQNCPCTHYRASHTRHGMARQLLPAIRLLLAAPLGFSSVAHLRGLILPRRAAAQGWGKRRALFPNTVPTLVNEVQGREPKKTPK